MKIYDENLELILNENNPFNRFLKLYHLLELQFDMHTAGQIKSLFEQGGKEREIGKFLRAYSREDIERLKSLMIMNCDAEELVPYLNKVKDYRAKALKIFYEYDKSSNPLKGRTKFESLLDLGSFSEENIEQVGINSPFDKFIPNLASYWIYRVRSSVAHSKLGEYLMTADDEDIIIDFAEPLLRKVVLQVFSK